MLIRHRLRHIHTLPTNRTTHTRNATEALGLLSKPYAASHIHFVYQTFYVNGHDGVTTEKRRLYSFPKLFREHMRHLFSVQPKNMNSYALPFLAAIAY